MPKKIAQTIFFLTLFLAFVQPVVRSATFTVGFAKRDAPGPFTAAPIIQGAISESDAGDTLTFSRGTQIGGNFYQNFDNSQGTVSFFFAPEFNSATDSGNRRLIAWATNTGIRVTNSNLIFQYNGTDLVSVTSVGLTAGQAYHIVARWDTKNTLDGTNYASLSVNDSHTFGRTSAFTAIDPSATINVGSASDSTGNALGIIEGLMVYRRPLYDGSAGIDVGNGDEISQIYNSGAGKDPGLVTGSWDVVFALPTDNSVGALSTGTGNAWAHPYSSNLVPGNSNTGGYMLVGTVSTDGWSSEGSPTSVSALASSEKIFAGGYKFTVDAANEGMYQDITVSAGDDWVVRALAHSDGTCTPKTILYDQTTPGEIGALTGTTTSTRTDPDVFIFAGEAVSGMTTLRLKLINTAASGTCYWHQAEVLSNLFTNPSLETGSGNPFIPTGWTNRGLDSGDSAQETTTVHSGSSSVRLATTASNEGFVQNLGSGTFLGTGAWFYGDGSSAMRLAIVTQQNVIGQDGATTFAGVTTASWTHVPFIVRRSSDSLYGLNAVSGATGNRYSDDFYVISLLDVSLTATAASEANSTENTDELRVDGRDTYVASSAEATSIETNSGIVTFNWRPRHDAANAVKFSETTSKDAYIISFFGDADDYIRVYWDSNNNVVMSYSMVGTTASGTWSAIGAVSANTEYAVEVAYTGGSTMTLKVGGTTRITLSSIPSAFGTAPATVYFGSDTDGVNQGDSAFSSIEFDDTPPSISLDSLSPDPNNDNTPTISGTATEAIGTVSNVQFQMDGTSGSWGDCSADDGDFDEASEAFDCTAGSLSDGSHTMYVRATDSNSNTTSDGDASTDTFTIDATAPTISVTAVTDPTNDSTPTVTGTATDATTSLTDIEFQVDSTSGSWTNCTATDGSIDETSEAFSCTTVALSDGSHTIYIRATDSATNTTASDNYGTDTFTIDTTAPTLALTAISPDPTTDTTPTLTGTATDATSTIQSVEFQIDSTSGTWSDCTADDGTFNESSETFSCTPSALNDGSTTIYIRATDNASNTSSAASDSFVIDTTEAEKGDLDYPDNGAYINQERPTFIWKSFTDDTSGLSEYKFEIDNEDGSGFTIEDLAVSGTSTKTADKYVQKFDGFEDSDSTNDYLYLYTKSSSQWLTSENDGKLKNGKNTWKITAYDSAGNTVSSSRTFYVDLTVPTLTGISVDNLDTRDGYFLVTSQQPVISGTAKDNLALDKLELLFYKQNFLLGIETSRTLVSTQTITFNGSEIRVESFFSHTSETLDYGKYTLTVKAYDKAQNVSDSVDLPIQLLTSDQAKVLLEDRDKIKEQQSISIPELEKKVRLRREVEAEEFRKLTTAIESSIKSLANALISIFGEPLENLFDESVRGAKALAGIITKVANQINNQINLALANISAKGNALYQKLALATPRVLSNALLVARNTFNTLLSELENTQMQAHVQIVDSQTQLNAVIQNISKSVSNANANLTQSFLTTQQNTKEAFSTTYKSSETLTKIKDGTNTAWVALKKPPTKEDNFVLTLLKSSKIAFLTFESYVFDEEPTKIANVTLEERGKDYVVISWETNHITRNNKVNYGETLSYGEEIWAPDGAKYHITKIENLKPNTRYFFEVMSQNKNYAYDAYYSFTTLEE